MHTSLKSFIVSAPQFHSGQVSKREKRQWARWSSTRTCSELMGIPQNCDFSTFPSRASLTCLLHVLQFCPIQKATSFPPMAQYQAVAIEESCLEDETQLKRPFQRRIELWQLFTFFNTVFLGLNILILYGLLVSAKRDLSRTANFLDCEYCLCLCESAVDDCSNTSTGEECGPL